MVGIVCGLMEKSTVGGTYANVSSTNHWNNQIDPRGPGEMTLANEFELDVNQLTHTFQSLTAVAPLPGIPNTDNNKQQRKTTQLNTFAIDLGMMREIISVQGKLIDRKENPSSSSGHHIRRQHLLAMVRAQYAFLRELDPDDTDAWLNINKFPPLTIGPIYDRTTASAGDSYYTGDQPSDDIRGTEHVGPDFTASGTVSAAVLAQMEAGAQSDTPEPVYSSWDFKPNVRANRSADASSLIMPKSLSKFLTGAFEFANCLECVMGALLSTMVLPPQLTPNRLAASSMSTPAEFASAKASAAATVLIPTRSWLINFIAVPAPFGPSRP